VLRSAARVSAVILHKAEWCAALQSQKPSYGERRAESVIRIGGPHLPAGFLLTVRQLARLPPIAALFAKPPFGGCRKRLRFF